jgi:hypothetical protein
MQFFYLSAPDTNSTIKVLILSNLPIFPVGILLVLCFASTRKNLSLGQSFGGCGFDDALFR